MHFDASKQIEWIALSGALFVVLVAMACAAPRQHQSDDYNYYYYDDSKLDSKLDDSPPIGEAAEELTRPRKSYYSNLPQPQISSITEPSVSAAIGTTTECEPEKSATTECEEPTRSSNKGQMTTVGPVVTAGGSSSHSTTSGKSGSSGSGSDTCLDFRTGSMSNQVSPQTKELHQLLQHLYIAQARVQAEATEIKKAQALASAAQSQLEEAANHVRAISAAMQSAQQEVAAAAIRAQTAQLQLAAHDQLLFAARQDVDALSSQMVGLQATEGVTAPKVTFDVTGLLNKLKQPLPDSEKPTPVPPVCTGSNTHKGTDTAPAPSPRPLDENDFYD